MWFNKKKKAKAARRALYEIKVYEWMELCRQRNNAEARMANKCKSAEDWVNHYANRPAIIPPPVWEE